MTTALLVMMVLAAVFAMGAGITGFASEIKERLQQAANLDQEEARLLEEVAGFYSAAKAGKVKALTEAQTKRKAEIEGRLEEIKVLRADNDAALEIARRQQEIERRTPGVRVEVGEPLAADKPWASAGEFLQAIALCDGRLASRVNIPGKRAGTVDPRLMGAATGGNVSVPADGEFLVQRDFSTKLVEEAMTKSVLYPLTDSYECSEGSDGVEMPTIVEDSRANGSRHGGVLVYRRKEAATVAATKIQYGDFEIRLEDLMGISYLTGRTLQDARLTEQVVTRAVSAEFAFKIDDEIYNGQGAGEMTGVLNSACKVEVAAEGGQAAGSIVPKNISKMWRAMRTLDKPNSAWFYNGELGPTLDELFIPAGVGALEPRFINYGPDGILRIKGRPVIEIEHAAAPGTAGDFALLNLNQFLTIRKGGMQSDQSMHVRFLYDEMAFRFIMRINGKAKRKTATAPYKGTVSKSPFVVLGAR